MVLPSKLMGLQRTTVTGDALASSDRIIARNDKAAQSSLPNRLASRELREQLTLTRIALSLFQVRAQRPKGLALCVSHHARAVVPHLRRLWHQT